MALSAAPAFASLQDSQSQAEMLTAINYAKDGDLTPLEAAQRLQAQRAAGELDAKLQTERPDTFAGLYIEHEPDFRIVVMFTRNASSELAAYTKDKLYVAQEAPRSLELLRTVQDEAANQLMKSGIEFEAGLDIRTSTITLYVRDPALARRRLGKLLAEFDFIALKETSGFIQTTGTAAARWSGKA
jgi:hypothetical protein